MGVGSSSDGSCAARSVRVRRRAAMTRSDGVDGRYAQLEQRFEPLPGLASKRRGSRGGSRRACDDRGILRVVESGENPARNSAA